MMKKVYEAPELIALVCENEDLIANDPSTTYGDVEYSSSEFDFT